MTYPLKVEVENLNQGRKFLLGFSKWRPDKDCRAKTKRSNCHDKFIDYNIRTKHLKLHLKGKCVIPK